MPLASLSDPVIVAAIIAFVIYWLFFCTLELCPLRGALIKASSSALLAVASLATPDLWPISLGLALGSVGDFALARPGTKAFLIGMAAFGLGHLSYAVGFILRAGQIGFTPPSTAEIIAGIVVITLVASTEFWLAPRTGALRAPVRAYGVIIGLMALSALMLPDHPGLMPLRAGVALFCISDTLLGLCLFVAKTSGRKNQLLLTVWPVYWIAQALILIGASSYWAV